MMLYAISFAIGFLAGFVIGVIVVIKNSKYTKYYKMLNNNKIDNI